MKKLLTLAVMMFSLVVLQGCGNDSNDKKAATNSTAAASSEANSAAKIAGVWTCDAEASLALHPQAKELDANPTGKEAAIKILETMKLTIDDKTMKMGISFGSAKEESDFVVKSVNGNDYVLGSKEDQDTVTVTLGKNAKGKETLTMSAKELGQTVVFARD